MKAKRELERIKKVRAEKAAEKEAAEKERAAKDERQKAAMKRQFEKRKIQHGVATRNTADEEKEILFREGAYERLKSREQKLAPEIRLAALEEEDPGERESVQTLLAKYRKLWRYLFGKYANSQYSVAKQAGAGNFEQIQGKKQTISTGELLRMLKEHELLYSHVSREEVTTLVRLLNVQQRRAELTTLAAESFEPFVLQTAVLAFSRPPLDLSGLPPLAQVQALVTHLAKVAKQNKFATFLYEDPEASALGDSEMLRELNRQVEKDPDAPVPEGYKKVREKQIAYKYALPPLLEVPAAKRVALELLEELVFGALDIHILEPLAEQSEQLKVRPVVKRVKAKQALFMEERSKPGEKPGSEEQIAAKLEAAQEKAKERKATMMRQEVRPRLGVLLKLGVARAEAEERAHVQETAEVLEEILAAAEKGLDALPERRKYAGGLDNRVKEQKAATKEAEAEKQREREAKLARRKEEVKAQLEVLKAEKQEKAKEKKEREAAKEARRKERKEADDAKWAKKIMERQEKVKEERDKKALLEEEKEAKKMRKKEKEAEALKDMHQKFLNDQKRMLVLANKRASKERAKERIERATQEERDKRRLKVTKHYFEAKVKAFEDRRAEKLQRLKQGYQAFWEHAGTQDTLARYGAHLRTIFAAYAKLNVELSSNRSVEQQYETLTLKKCLQFAYDFHVTPTLVQADDFIYSFNAILKEATARRKALDAGMGVGVGDPEVKVMDYRLFEELLVRVAVLGRRQLGHTQTMAQVAEEEEERDEKEKLAQMEQEEDPSAAAAAGAAGAPRGHPVNQAVRKKKQPGDEELWQPELDTTGLSERSLAALFDYFGLDLEDELPVLKRRLKELNNQKQMHQPAARLPKVPLTLKEERAAKKKLAASPLKGK